jgi:SAM-dependent methyltransferase
VRYTSSKSLFDGTAGYFLGSILKRAELLYLLLERFFVPLNGQVRRKLISIAKPAGPHPRMLDVGCRTSPYTIGVPAHFVLTDLPKTTELQEALYLGLTGAMIQRQKARRSNVHAIVYDDMTCSSLANETFECVVSVEVLEHVERDDLFVAEVHRVLKRGGVFVMTTPNGDFVREVAPDHKRHYQRRQLLDLLKTHFERVSVDYAIRGGKTFEWGHDSWSLRKPWKTAWIMANNFINGILSSGESIKTQADGTQHLVAVAWKKT